MLKEILNDINNTTEPLIKSEKTELLNEPMVKHYDDDLSATFSLVEHSGLLCLRVDEESLNGGTEEYIWPGSEEDFNEFVEMLKGDKLGRIHRIILYLMQNGR